MNRPIVSVIIPAFNAEKYIEETLASVINQSYANFEMIIVDDGSTDRLKDCVFNFCKKDKRVKYIYQPNGGVSASRNAGFTHSSGIYIAFLDADDVWMPDNLMVKLSKFENGNYGLVHSNGYLIDDDSKVKEGTIFGSEGMLLDNMLKLTDTQVPGPSSILVKREVLNSIGLFDTNLSTSADFDFFIRVASRYSIGRVDQFTWKYRLHQANMHKNILLLERDMLYVYSKVSANNLFRNVWFERSCYATLYLMLAASWAGDGRNILRSVLFVLRAFITHPSAIANLYSRLIRFLKKSRFIY